MLLSLAPMEGITGYAFRRVHAEVFGALGRYYTPFISPLPKVGTPFSKRNSRELDPANNQGLDVVPQLLTNDADRFVWAAELLADMGYKEVNLNLGCPSGTVVAKEKGSGLLRNPDRLEAFLANVCERSPLPVSVKTRVGIANDDEYGELFALFCRCGIAELIVHPRVQKDFYNGSPRQELYGKTLELAPFPVAYNGDVFTLGDYDALLAAYPQTRHVMLGRGLLANPALAREIRGGEGLARGTQALPRQALRVLYRRHGRQRGIPHEGMVVLRRARIRRPALSPPHHEKDPPSRRVRSRRAQNLLHREARRLSAIQLTPRSSDQP